MCFGTPSYGFMVVALIVMISEVLRNNLYLQGQTEWQVIVRMTTICLRRIAFRPRFTRFAVVVPENPQAPEPTPGAPEPSLATPEWYGQYVAAKNDYEMLVIFMVSSAFAFAKVSPSHPCGDAIPWVRVLIDFCMLFVFEVVSDFLTAAYANKWNGGCGAVVLQRYRDADLVALRRVVGAVAITMTTGFLVFTLASMCPCPSTVDVKLLSLGPCPGQGLL